MDPLLRFDEVAVEDFSLSFLLRDDLPFSRFGVGLLLLLLDGRDDLGFSRLGVVLLLLLLDGRDDLGFSRFGVGLLLLLLDGLLDRLGDRESSE